MTPERVRAISETLNTLTDDEDTSQDAWIIMLETGVDPFKALEIAATQAAFTEDLAYRVVYLAKGCDHILPTIKTFHEAEQNILLLLMMGFSVQEIIQYNGICTVRLAQMLASISLHPCWREKHGIEDTIIC